MTVKAIQMNKLYICRGLPGSGKSTYARTLAPLVIEPDMFRYDAENRYVFRADENRTVHEKAECLCEYAMRQLRMPAIAVTAVFTELRHMMTYVRLGRRYGYDITVVECTGSYGNVHAVPDDVIAGMRMRFEHMDEELANQEGVALRRVVDGVCVSEFRAGGCAE